LKADSILFDLDGTIWDSTEPAAVVWNQVAKRNPSISDKVTGEGLKKVYGLPLEEIARRIFKSVPEEVALQTMEICVVEQNPYFIENRGALLGDVEKVLKGLKEMGYRLFIISNCRAGYIEAFLEAWNFAKYFEDIISPGISGKLKADNIRIICDKWNLKASVYVGDTKGDGDASYEAGVPFVYARYGFGSTDQFDAVVDSFEELLEEPWSKL